MLKEERNLLENLEKLKGFRIAETGFVIDVPTDILTNIVNDASEIRRKQCWTEAEASLTKYCNSLRHVELGAKEVISEFNGIKESLDLGLIMVEEVAGIISSNISDFLDEKSIENVSFRSKDLEESEKIREVKNELVRTYKCTRNDLLCCIPLLRIV